MGKKRIVKRSKNKKGAIELGWQFFFSLFFVILILSLMLWFVARQSGGDLVQTQIIAKEVCILAAGAKQGSVIEVEHARKIIIEKKDFGVLVKGSELDRGYFYPCYLKNVEFTRRDNRTYIEITKIH